MSKTTKATKNISKPVAEFSIDSVRAVIEADYAACAQEVTAGNAVFQTCCALIRACPMALTSDFVCFNAELSKVFADMPEKLAVRRTLLANARKVQEGGKNGKVLIAGRGRQAMLDALDSVKSLRDLRGALVKAKPEALKQAPKSAEGSVAHPVKTVKAKPAQVDTGFVLQSETATASVRKILAAYESLLKPSQCGVIAAVEALIKAIADDERAATKPTAKEIKAAKDKARDEEIARLIHKAA